MLTVTPIYLAIAAALYSIMAFTVIGNRRRRRLSIGDGDQPDFVRIVRGHANFAEYAPITLLAIGIAELTGVPAAILHLCGALLIVGRAMHAYCFLFTTEGMKLRVGGMVLTFFSLWIAAAAGAIYAIT